MMARSKQENKVERNSLKELIFATFLGLLPFLCG
jgi:hypothetical protein